MVAKKQTSLKGKREITKKAKKTSSLKLKKKNAPSEEAEAQESVEEESEELDDDLGGEISINLGDDEDDEDEADSDAPGQEGSTDHLIDSSKPISEIKKKDRIIIDSKAYDVDAHYVLIDHGTTKEMVIELFDSSDKDYQLRYFDDQVERTLELYELDDIIYNRKSFVKISW